MHVGGLICPKGIRATVPYRDADGTNKALSKVHPD
jgi:hypothetical protein